MSKRGKRWLREHNRDQFVNRARRERLRSRAAFKLEEMDQRYKLFQPGQTVVDLGAAPGSWSGYASEKIGLAGKVIAIDLLEMQPVENVTFLQGDIADKQLLQRCISALNNDKADLVISDMAPNLSGIAVTDQANSLYLAEQARDLACSALKNGGHLLVKLFQGAGIDTFRKELMKKFQKVTLQKPQASRSSSSEIYVLAKGYCPGSDVANEGASRQER